MIQKRPKPPEDTKIKIQIIEIFKRVLTPENPIKKGAVKRLNYVMKHSKYPAWVLQETM